MLSWMNFIFRRCSTLVFQYMLIKWLYDFNAAIKTSIELPTRQKEIVSNPMCYAKDGFRYQLFFWNDPAPHKYTNMVLSLLHARTMDIFDTIYDEYQHCAMDTV